MYGLLALYLHYPSLLTQLRRFLYHSIRNLLQIKTLPKMDDLILQTTGVTAQDYFSLTTTV